MNKKVTFRKNIHKKKKFKKYMQKDFFEKQEWGKNQLVCGVDEVGRGCLAGPLVVAAVILYPNNRLKLLKDSKVLTREELLKVYPRIISNSWYSFGIINNIDIDKFNIWRSTLLAMRQAIMNLFAICPKLPTLILSDNMPISLENTHFKDIEIQYFPEGESISRSIAAASIIAKVKRDSLMQMYDEYLPGYEFGKHKGYGTKDHQNALSKNGQSILHRESFLKKFKHLFNKEFDFTQINLFEQIEIINSIDKE